MVTGLAFTNDQGWDSSPWYDATWELTSRRKNGKSSNICFTAAWGETYRSDSGCGSVLRKCVGMNEVSYMASTRPLRAAAGAAHNSYTYSSFSPSIPVDALCPSLFVTVGSAPLASSRSQQFLSSYSTAICSAVSPVSARAKVFLCSSTYQTILVQNGCVSVAV